MWESLDHCGIKLMVDYPVIPKPRAGDELLSDLFAKLGAKENDLPALQRCRNARGMLWMSNMTSANGRQTENRWLRPADRGEINPTALDFTREESTKQDWSTWSEFWLRNFGPGLALVKPLDPWLHTSHRFWEWFYFPTTDEIVHVGPSASTKYGRAKASRVTRSRGNQYQ